jgi:hypothetical protein
VSEQRFRTNVFIIEKLANLVTVLFFIVSSITALLSSARILISFCVLLKETYVVCFSTLKVFVQKMTSEENTLMRACPVSKVAMTSASSSSLMVEAPA